MIINEIIRKRKSIRKYDPTPLDDAALKKVHALIEGLKPLYPEIRYSIEVTSKTKGMFNIKTPHYLVFLSEEKDGYLENIGFIGQQLDLLLSASGIGTCWLGAAKPTDSPTPVKQSPVSVSDDISAGKAVNPALSHVICMSFGNPAEPLHRELSAFKRKPLSAISEGDDPRLEAARLAPSAINAQNWYFIADSGKIHCYRKKANPLLGLMFNKMHCIDMGIAICHLAEESEDFRFTHEADAPVRKGCVYTGTVN